MGTEAKNAPSVNTEIPPKHNRTPPIIVSMAIIETPIGLFTDCANLSVCLTIFQGGRIKEFRKFIIHE